MARQHKQWHRRGYLPHYDAAGAYQSITYRLADALPAAVVARLEQDLPGLGDSERDVEKRRRIEAWMDAGHGSCLLSDPAVARIVVESWFHHAGERYDLSAFVVMPNHVHLLVRQRAGWPLGTLVRDWKSFTSHAINKHLNRQGPLWHPDYFDRFIRDERHFLTTQQYIHQNPVRAGLVDVAEEYEASSAALLVAA